MGYRIGYGIDYHQLSEGRQLYIGGVHIPHTKSAMGHSDDDILLHVICDTLLGAAWLGDIGVDIPHTDGGYKGTDSKILLKEVVALIQKESYLVVNIDSTLCREAPT